MKLNRTLPIMALISRLLIAALCCPAMATEGDVSVNLLSVIFTGETRGYLEPCGCSRPQLGGLSRRHTLINCLCRGESGLLLDNGDVVKRFGEQALIKFEIILTAMNEMGYAALNIGEKDLLLGLDYLKGASQIAGFPFISANLKSHKSGRIFSGHLIKTYKVKGRTIRIAIIGLLGKEFEDLIRGVDNDLYIQEPEEALTEVLSEIAGTYSSGESDGKCEFVILLAHTDESKARKLAEAFPAITLVICGHERDEPFAKPIRAAGIPTKNMPSSNPGMERSRAAPRRWIATPGTNGKYLAIYGIGAQGSQVTSHPLDETIADSTPIIELLDYYQELLKTQNLLARKSNERLKDGLSYIGSQACKDCHLQETQVWRASEHARAYQTLVQANRDYDPECVECHTTGFKYVSGFKTFEETPEMAGVGCEDCHGPGGRHVKDTTKKTPQQIGKKTCAICHNFDRSPGFDFEKYWAKVKHGISEKRRRSH